MTQDHKNQTKRRTLTPSVTRDTALALAAQAGASGITSSDVAHARGITQQSAAILLGRMAADGLLVNVRRSHKDSRYYLPEHAPTLNAALKEKKIQPLTSIRAANVRLDPGAEAISTPATKITSVKAPPGRFEFQPPPGWKGQITRDWRERRLQEAQR